MIRLNTNSTLRSPAKSSVASLNQLLKGKGVLENQGQAFSLRLLQVSMKFT